MEHCPPSLWHHSAPAHWASQAVHLLHGHTKDCDRFCPQVFEDAGFEGLHFMVTAKPATEQISRCFCICQGPGTNLALVKGSQSHNKSRSGQEEEWAEHHSRKQREMEIINRQNIPQKWFLGAAYGNLRHQRTKESCS